jgi:phospholipid-binding lipoprotein MlaA
MISDISVRNSLYGLEVVQRREALLDVTDTIDRTALDRYSFIRDAYLKRRTVQVDGFMAEAQSLPDYEDEEAAPADRKALGIPPKN